MFFGTDKGLIEGVGDMNAVCKKSDLLALAEAMGTINNHDPPGEDFDIPYFGDAIHVGSRHRALLSYANTVLKRFGHEDNKAYELFMRRTDKCEEPLPDNEIKAIWRDAKSYYEKTISKDPNYIPPAEYAVQDFAPIKSRKVKQNPISYYTDLAGAYMSEHKYIVDVQRLSKGGYGNDTVYEYVNGVWKARSESDVKSVMPPSEKSLLTHISSALLLWYPKSCWRTARLI